MSGIGKITRIDDLEISDLTGVVVSLQGWTETSTTATTTTTIGTWNNNTSTKLSSSSTEKMRLFIRDESGKEHAEQITDPQIGIREGHKVSLIYVSAKSASQHARAGLLVHDTGDVRTFRKQIGRLVNLVNPAIGCLWLLLVPIAAWVLVYVQGPSWGLHPTLPFPLMAAIGAFLLVLFVLNIKRRKAVAMCLAIEARVKEAAARLSPRR